MVDDSISTGTWPAGYRAALLTVVHVPGAADIQLVANPGLLTGIDYLATGLQRLLTSIADLDLPVTTAWTAAGLLTSPPLARMAADNGADLAISLASESTTMVPEFREAASRLFDEEINGVADLLDSGKPVSSDEISRFGWSLTRSGGDFPVLNGSVDDDSDHVSIPTSPWWNDYAWWNPAAPQPPSSFLETLSTGLQSVRTIGGLMTLVIHPHISGRPGFSDTIVRFADEAIGSGDVWIPTATDLADWWRQRQFRAE